MASFIVKLRMEHKLLFLILLYTLGTGLVSMEELSYRGNVTVVGLFEIYESDNGDCGPNVVPSSVMAAEAVKWYLRLLNEAGDTKLDIGLKGYKTCRLNHQAAQIAIDVMSKTFDQNNADAQTTIGVIGPEYSSEIETVSPIFSSADETARLLITGYSTTAEPLRNPGNTFPNLFRTVPNDMLQIGAMVQAMKIMEWDRIAIIYEGDIYGRTAMQLLTDRAGKSDICVSYTASINNTNGLDSREIEEISRALLIGSGERQTIHSFVFFGSPSTANLLLQKMNSLGFSNVPIGMFSDAINLDMRAFMYLNKLIAKTKGSLVTSPTYRVIQKFQEHWKGIFTDKDKFELDTTTNPWLYDVYTHLKPCQNEPCEFIPLTNNEFETSFSFQPVYIQYALIATHTIVKAFNSVYNSYCPPNIPTCDFFEHFQQGDMIKTVDTIQLNFDTDFSVRLESLSGIQMSFDENGEPNLGETTPSYQLFNLRHANIDSGPVTFVKIGDFSSDHLTLNTSDVIDYQDDSTAMVWPNVRKGQCGAQKKCGECIPDDLPFWFVYDPGDLYIVGLVPVHDRSGTQECGEVRPYHGYQLVEAIRFAAQKFNDPTGPYLNYQFGVRIGVIVLNTCNNPAVIQRKILNLHKDGLRLINGSVIPMENKVLGYAGPLGSTVSISTSWVLDNLKKVSVSYAATNPTLSDRGSFKYFMRVVSPDNEQANAMAEILKTLHVNYIQVLYSEGAYGEGGISSLRPVLKAKGICIIQDIKVPESASNSYYEYYENLRKYPHARVVIIFLRSHVVTPLMTILSGQMDRGEFIFIGSEAWAKNTDVLDNDDNHALLGSYSFVIEMAQDSELLSHVQKIQPDSYSVNPWSRQYLQAKWRCYYSTSFNKQYPDKCGDNFSPLTTLDGWSTSAYLSALSLLIGSGSFVKSVCGTGATVLCDDYLNNPTGLMAEIQSKVKLDVYGTGDLQKVFNDNGDGNIGYAIYNIQRDPDNIQALQYKKVGQYPLLGTFTFDKNLIVYPTGEDLVSRCPNEQACVGCVDQASATESGEDDKGLGAAVIVLLVLLLITLAVVFVLGVLLFLLKRRQHNEQQVYLTPAPPEDERPKRDYVGFERPDAVGESDETCNEPPHTTRSSSAESQQMSPL